MAKYILFLKNQISLITAYRFDLAWRWLSNLFEIITYFSLWSLTTGGSDTEIRRLLIYYILFFGILHNLQSSRVAAWMGEDISSGQLNNYLTKPINFPLITVIRTSAMLISRCTVPVILFIIGVVLFPSYLAPASFSDLVLFLLFSTIGLIIWNLLMVIVGSLAFWFTEIKSLVTVLDVTLSSIKGAFIPVYLFSDQIKSILSFTPFNYLASFPTDIYQGLLSRNQIIYGLLISSFWVIFLYFSSHLIYSRGVRKYEAFG